MSRNARCILPGLPYHVTQRGTDRQDVFFSTGDRLMYLRLLAAHQRDAGVRILAYCLMTNHVHLVVVPERADSLAVLFRRVHGSYAQALNTRRGRTGHLWQNRFFSCPMSESHLWIGIRYVEANPLRARMAEHPEHYRWSSAPTHLGKVADRHQLLDTDFWNLSGGVQTWRELHDAPERWTQTQLLRRCTYAGRPFGEEAFVASLEATFQRRWRRWSFEKSLDNRMLA